MQNTNHLPFVRYHLGGFKTLPAVSLLDTQDNPLDLDFSKLSGCEGWMIDANWGDNGIAIVTCDWPDCAFYVADMTAHDGPCTRERIASRGEIVPFVKAWLTSLQARGGLYATQPSPKTVTTPALNIRGMTT
jgi:hypothetical protein